MPSSPLALLGLRTLIIVSISSSVQFISDKGLSVSFKQVAQWATVAHLGASIMFGDTIMDDAQRQVTMNLKQ